MIWNVRGEIGLSAITIQSFLFTKKHKHTLLSLCRIKISEKKCKKWPIANGVICEAQCQ